jgi:hypothetical protein
MQRSVALALESGIVGQTHVDVFGVNEGGFRGDEPPHLLQLIINDRVMYAPIDILPSLRNIFSSTFSLMQSIGCSPVPTHPAWDITLTFGPIPSAFFFPTEGSSGASKSISSSSSPCIPSPAHPTCTAISM